MITSVLERRSEIGLRRALGATRGNIRTQFLSEAILLSLCGGAIGVALGRLATAICAHAKHLAFAIHAEARAGGTGAATVIGVVAGPLPAVRAARMSPTEACAPSDHADQPGHAPQGGAASHRGRPGPLKRGVVLAHQVGEELVRIAAP